MPLNAQLNLTLREKAVNHFVFRPLKHLAGTGQPLDLSFERFG
jgi:hypothetical protein